MTRLVGATALVVAALTMVALTGCAQEPETVVTPTPTPTPTETAEPASRPNPLFAIDCAGLLTLDEVQARVSAPVSVKRDESNVSGVYTELTWSQRGALSCHWGSEGRSNISFDDGATLLLLPNGGDEFAAHIQSVGWKSVDVSGADSAGIYCLERERGFGYCLIVALVGTTFAELGFSDSGGQYQTEEAISGAGIALLETAIARMVSAGPREQEWAPPAPSLQANSAFCDAAGADLFAALGVGTEFGGPRPADLFPGLTACEFYFGATDVPSVGIWIVESAGWVAGVPHTEAPELGAMFESRTTASGAPWWLSPSGESVRGRAAVDGSLIEVYIFGTDVNVNVSDEQARAAITAFMEQYAEVPPGT